MALENPGTKTYTKPSMTPIPLPLAFEEAAKSELENAQLRRNLHKATHTIRDKRAAVVSELPDWEALRDAGQAIKAEVMRNLDTYLVRLERSVTDAGGQVHWARDAARSAADRHTSGQGDRHARGHQGQVHDH